ncbi:hypothetical protein BU14_0056s0042 [Porphyra umbilicalis]|uniref:Peptidase S1 domain-containing protein n=1 Tax=Porphyra umbilicalis TaxID=2786 RepID=A0A1X6PHC6_PORUM|nr:hypothetical protein BU14_0056s0042 [Porphyra umbilicalis]|eukprot:OSX80260.1 hypothetical protein BU14_0056s0042 [Porphyra umbilicalis]
MASMRTLAVAAVAAVAAIAVGAAPAAAAVATDPLTVYSSSRSTPLAATPPPKPLSPGRRTRIVGGRTVTDVDPETGSQFVAKIFTADGAGFYCGGSFVSASHVLTRAGCRVVVGDVVRVGGAKLWDGLWYRVKEVKNHPAYDPAGDVNDLAVLVLANPKSESEMLAAGVVPVKITTDFGSPHGFYVSGFGCCDRQCGAGRGEPAAQARLPAAPPVADVPRDHGLCPPVGRYGVAHPRVGAGVHQLQEQLVRGALRT